MTRSPLHLAALASAAVPGLGPVSVEGVRVGPDSDYEVAFVEDSQERRWVVRAPRTAAVGAVLHDATRLAALLARRLDVSVPLVRGYAEIPEGMAVIYPWLPGRPLDFSGLDDGRLAADLGRTIAHVHNVERAVYEEAERPSYDAEAHRQRLLSDLDRAAATGHVPTTLLTRWETRLEDVSLWRFAPTPIHGSLAGSHVLATFDDPTDAESGHVRALLAWEHARTGDPADDFAALAVEAPPEALDAVLEGYTHARVERPDPGLLARAGLAGEMHGMWRLLRALARGDRPQVDAAAGALRALAEDILAVEEERSLLAAAEEAQAAERAAALREHEEPAWDATQPHQPFPATGVTQLIEPASMAASPGAPSAAPPVAPSVGSPEAPSVASAAATEPPLAAELFEIDDEPDDDTTHDEPAGTVDAVEPSEVAAPADDPVNADEADEADEPAEGADAATPSSRSR